MSDPGLFGHEFRATIDQPVGAVLPPDDRSIHMRDASHPEREFVEWVSPDVGRRRNAELCQAHAFGITLEQWLSVDLEG